MTRPAWLALVLGLAAPAGPGARAGEPTPRPVDLLADRDAWSSWSARPALAPGFAAEPKGGPGGQPALVLTGGGNPDVCGCWKRALPPLKKDRRYLLEAAFRAEKVPLPGRSAWALVARDSNEFGELAFGEVRDGWRRVALELNPDRDWDGLELRLYLAWAADGRLAWSDARLTDVTDVPVKKRAVRAAAVSGRPKGAATPAESLDYFCARVDEAAKGGADLVVLPEVINTDGVAGKKADLAEPIPGPTTRRLGDKAREHRTYVAASLLEKDGDRLYNTGVLLDRTGAVVGKYRKTHPTIGEAFYTGVTPGDDYPVFDADFGRVGYMICYDNHYLEVARILALKGARVLVFSNMADGREDGAMWEPYMRTRAVDNNVHIVAAVNAGRSCVVSPRGEVLAVTEKGRGGTARAGCDLRVSVRNFTKRGIGDRYLQLRRFDTFGPLAAHHADLKAAAADAPPTFIPTDVDYDRPLYSTSFDKEADLADWVLEGGKRVAVEKGDLVLTNGPDTQAGGGHLVAWLRKEFPADFLLEFTFRPEDRKRGLAIAFFNARGKGGEDVLDPGLAKRDGLFKQYHSGDLDNYHVSYWAGDRGTAHVRKNRGFHLAAEGKDLVAGAAAGAWQTVRVYKRGGAVRLTVDDKLALSWDDDGKTYGPVHARGGWVGLRQMAHTGSARYGRLAVYPIRKESPR